MMTGITSKALRELQGAIDGRVERKSPKVAQSVTGTVTGAKAGALRVLVDGAAESTPVDASACDVSVGDAVTCVISDGSMSITGNTTAPATSQKAVNATVAPIVEMATTASDNAASASRLATTAAAEAAEISETLGQHFWSDDGGAHVTDVPMEEWQIAEAADFPDASDTKQYSNILLNSLGMLIRAAKKTLVSVSRSAISFFDGSGSDAANVVATFGADGAQIGRSNESHIKQDYHSFKMVDKEGNTYVHFSDLRNEDGYYDYTREFYDLAGSADSQSSTGRSIACKCDRVDAADTIVDVTLDGVSVTDYRKDSATVYISVSDTTTSHDATVTWRTVSSLAKAFTIGTRNGTASGDYSCALGRNNRATKSSCVAIGETSNATGRNSIAMGQNADATGANSIAMGYMPDATGDDSIAMGWRPKASGDYAAAIGYRANAMGDVSVAIGASAETGAMDGDTKAGTDGTYALAFGMNSKAIGKGSTALGVGASSPGIYAMAIGHNASAAATSSYAIGNGSSATGGISFAAGYMATATGDGSFALGPQATATDGNMSIKAASNINLQSPVKAEDALDVAGAATLNGAFAHTANGVSLTYPGAWLSALYGGMEQLTQVSDIIAPGSAVNVKQAVLVKWGRVRNLWMYWTPKNKITVPATGDISNITIGTLTEGNHPVVACAGHTDNAGIGPGWYTCSYQGVLTLNSLNGTGSSRTIAAGTYAVVLMTYLA